MATSSVFASLYRLGCFDISVMGTFGGSKTGVQMLLGNECCLNVPAFLIEGSQLAQDKIFRVRFNDAIC